MKIHSLPATLLLAIFLAGCATTTPAPAPTPTPASQPIDVISAMALPKHYTVVGTVMGYTIDMLKERARKLGADAIVKPTSVDPVSGWATTQAIKYTK